jgi:Ca2+-binding EF-hand superfamily protein
MHTCANARSKIAQTLLAASALALLAASALAQDASTDSSKARGLNSPAMLQLVEQRFKAADKNQDGLLTKAEAEAGMPKLAKTFDRIDTEKKGSVTLEQIKAFIAKNAAK